MKQYDTIKCATADEDNCWKIQDYINSVTAVSEKQERH